MNGNSGNVDEKTAYSTSANLSITLQIDTVDYYGQRRTDGGDPVSILITDPALRQHYFKSSSSSTTSDNTIVDFNNGSYRFTFTPNLVGRYRIDAHIFSRSIYQMPIYVQANEFVDPIWVFGGGGISTTASFGGVAIGGGGGGCGSASSTLTPASAATAAATMAASTLMRNFSFHNKGASDRDFNMPICVRCVDKFIYVLDAGNNRIKILNKSGQFVGNIKHDGLNESSATALAVQRKNGKEHLLTLNWRLKVLSNYSLDSKCHTNIDLVGIDEPLCLVETFHPDLYLIQDNKKRLLACNGSGRVVCESFEAKLRQECGLKSIVSMCGHLSERRLFVAGLTASNAASPIYEVSLDWLCAYKLDELLETLDAGAGYSTPPAACSGSDFISQAYSYPLGCPQQQQHQKSLSSSLTSLASTLSVTSTSTTQTSTSSSSKPPTNASSSLSNSNSTHGMYTALWHDKRTHKLLAAKLADKHTTVIEVFDTRTRLYEYSLVESSAAASDVTLARRPLKKVTSICSTDDGKLVCVDLVHNLAKFFRFI